MSASGHDPYSMSMPQLLAFDKARAERRMNELQEMMIIARAAQHADDKGFEKILMDMSGEDDPDTFDFDKL